MRYPGVEAERRQTLYLQGEVRAMASVYLDTDIDMTRVSEHRIAAERRYSMVSYVLHAVGRTLVRHPEANAAVRGRLWPRVARYPGVHGKLTLDKTLNGRRVVLSAVIPDVHSADLDAIQHQVAHYRDADAQTAPDFARIRALQRLPPPVGRLVFRTGVRPLGRRAALLGTVSVTSLGHRPVDGFHSSGGTTLTFGLGQIRPRPVVVPTGGTDPAHRLDIAPVMRLSLCFDHRVIDGAEAADVLGEVKTALEEYPV